MVPRLCFTLGPWGSTPQPSTIIVPPGGEEVNRLKPETQTAILAALVEGSSIRSVERMTGVHRDTIIRLLLRVGQTCESIMDATMRDLACNRLEVDEIWCYVGKKQRHVAVDDDTSQVGDFWTFVAFDPDSKLVPTYAVGKRDAPTARGYVARRTTFP